MVRASLYIILCSARNRLRVRVRRLREPRYLVGAIVGVAYLYFSFFARMRGTRLRDSRSRRRPPDPVLASLQAAGTGLIAPILLAMAAVGWLLPFDSGLLEFTDAEIEFLFPAPVLRRQLLIHRLMRSQLGLLFTAIVPAIAFPSATVASRLRLAVAMWLILVTGKVYFTGVTLARARLHSLSGGGRRLAWTPAAVIAGALAIVGIAIGREFQRQPPGGFEDFLIRPAQAVAGGLPRLVLLPFTALARPLFTPWPGPFLLALAASGGVLLVTVAWVLRSDEVFQEAVAEAAVRRAAKDRSRRAPVVTGRAGSWTLRPSGRAEGVFLWKNGLQMLRATSGLTLVRYLVPLVIVGTALSSAIMSANRARGGAGGLCLLAIAAGAFAVVMGPQIIRTDLRSDLRHLELLKTWPVKAAAVVRGEMLWPACVVTAFAWIAIVCATMFGGAAFPQVTLAQRLSIMAAAVLLAPALVAAQYTIHNVTVVLFPGWMPVGDQRLRGLDAMGQRLILLGGVLVSLVVMVLPGALAGGLIWFALRRFIGVAVLIPAAVVCGLIVLVEVLAATEAIAPLFERMDLLAVERAE